MSKEDALPPPVAGVGQDIYHSPTPPILDSGADIYSPSSVVNEWTESVDADGYRWREYSDGRAEWFDNQTGEWKLFEG